MRKLPELPEPSKSRSEPEQPETAIEASVTMEALCKQLISNAELMSANMRKLRNFKEKAEKLRASSSCTLINELQQAGTSVKAITALYHDTLLN